MGHKPTAEQEAILSAFPSGDDLVIEAGAGTGKTSTLKMAAATRPGKRGLYIAYNKSIQLDAAATFPASVTCKTAHGLAYQSTALRQRLGKSARMPAREVALLLRINEPFAYAKDRAPLMPAHIARIVTETVDRFCKSADTEIAAHHLPGQLGMDDAPIRDALAKVVLPLARTAWEDLLNPAGRMPYTHNAYLKAYQLKRPTLDCDYLMVDEGQDLNPVLKAIVESQDMQVVLVGDAAQSINGWNGAINAMETAQGKRLYLTKSWRFGPAIAEEANKWLSILDADIRLTGNDAVNSRVESMAAPDAILCRTNAACVTQVMRGLDQGRSVHLVGDSDQILGRAFAARDLKAGRRTDNAELAAFSSWYEVVDYAENDASGSDLAAFVRIVDKEGVDAIISAMRCVVRDEKDADLVVSTSHKSKGREWSQVRVADDFREPKASESDPTPEIDRTDAMLAYVTVTRARHVLDRGGLAWVDGWVPAWTATALNESGDTALTEPDLTGMPEEQADWAADEDLPVAVPPFPIGSRVRYKPTGPHVNRTVFTVTDARWSDTVADWLYGLRQPDGKPQRAIRGAVLVPADASPAPALAAPEPAVVKHCGRCGSVRCLCGPDEKALWYALAYGTTPQGVAAAVAKYRTAAFPSIWGVAAR